MNRLLLLPMVAFFAAGAGAEPAPHCPMHPAAKPAQRYERTTARYETPTIGLVDQDGRNISLADALPADAPVALNFIFTTCSTICPVMSATFEGLHRRLGKDGDGVRMVSVTVDPEHDSPAMLKAYGRRYGAGQYWTFLTGREQDVRSVLRTFNAVTGDKGNHRPVTLLRRAGARDWVRIDGLANAEELARELKTALAEK
jgi:protein SCO1/2